jgi:RNA polymerase sigma-70 factor (ECF subfamily)
MSGALQSEHSDGIASPGAVVGAVVNLADARPADDQLVVRSQRGDRAAFEQLVRRTARLVYARQYLETRDAHRAEDLSQETFLLAWRSIGQLTDPGGFRAWLLTIARSAATDAYRRDSRKKRAAGGQREDFAQAADAVADASPSPQESAEREESRRRVTGALKSLPEEYGLPLTLRYIAGADYETIGRQLGLSNGSLRGLLSRGMARLREKLKTKDEGRAKKAEG